MSDYILYKVTNQNFISVLIQSDFTQIVSHHKPRVFTRTVCPLDQKLPI